MSDPQKILDILATLYTNIGALTREQEHHEALANKMNDKIGEYRAKAAEIERELIKDPKKKDV